MEDSVVTRSRRRGRAGVKLCVGLLFLGFAVMVRYAMRDIRLDVDIIREGLLHMPGLVVENIQLERVVSGDLWRVRVPYLERDGSKMMVRSLDIRRDISAGGEWYFFGAEGRYDEKLRSADIRGLLGTLNAKDRVWNLESSELLYDEDKREFVFPSGITVYDDEFLLNAPKASMDIDGNVLFEKGGLLQWTKPLGR